MDSRKCPKCKEVIKPDAKKCKHCKADLRNWFVRHKILTVILVLVVLAVLGSNAEKKKAGSDELSLTKERCESVTIGMNQEQVRGVLGEPKTQRETQNQHLGTFTHWHYAEGFLKVACDITFSKERVSNRSWVDLR